MTSTVTLLADQAIDTEKLMLEGIDTTPGPLYSVSELSRFFFSRSSHWVRWLENCHYSEPVKDKKSGKVKQAPCTVPIGSHSEKLREQHRHTWKLVLDGELLVPLRTDSGARQYHLALIEKIAHALASNGTIKTTQLRHALLLVKIQAEMNDYL